MSLEFCSLSSGSSGNCYLVRSRTTAILVDAGISRKRIFEGLAETGTDPKMLRGIVITHEHSDHIKGLRVTSKHCPDATVYTNAGTWRQLEGIVEEDRQETFESGDAFDIGDIGVKTFRTSHDAADPVGFSFYFEGRQLSLITDTGVVSDDMLGEICDADLLNLESNHEPEVLRCGRYPYPLQQRILGDRGHLSNEAAAETIIKLERYKHKARQILLAHLSGNNNTPELAMQTVKNSLEDAGIYIGGELRIDVAGRDSVSSIYEV